MKSSNSSASICSTERSRSCNLNDLGRYFTSPLTVHPSDNSSR
jgi:hypothetical protein